MTWLFCLESPLQFASILTLYIDKIYYSEMHIISVDIAAKAFFLLLELTFSYISCEVC
jgi:hypothetical protein